MIVRRRESLEPLEWSYRKLGNGTVYVDVGADLWLRIEDAERPKDESEESVAAWLQGFIP